MSDGAGPQTGSDPFRARLQEKQDVRGKDPALRRFAVRVALLFAAVCTITGTLLPYLPVWLDWVGLSPREIAVIAALPLLVRVAVSPAIAFAADRDGNHRGFIVVLAWSALAAAVALAHSGSFWPILALTLAFSVAAGTVMPLAEAVAMAGVRAAGLDYGRMRLWGSLTFIAASAYGGLALDRFGPPAALWLIAGGAVCTALAAHALPRPSGGARPPMAVGRPRLSLADALGLMRWRLFVTFLAAVGAVQAAHATFYTFGTLHWVAQGYSSGWSGALWAIGVGVEIGLMAFSGALVRRIGAVELIVLGAVASAARWLAMGFDPPLAALVLLQALHGLTYGATQIGAFYFMTQAVPGRQAGTAQALYAASAGITMGGAMLLSGQLYAAYGGRAYWAMAAIAAAGLGASLALRKCQVPRL